MISCEVAITQVGRLFDNYNITATQQIREAKIRYLIEELKGFSDSDFVKVCDKILKESKNRSFPVLEDFTSRWHSVRTDQADVFINHKFCKRCEGTGYYTVWQLRGGGENKRWYGFPYRCSCNTVTMQSLKVVDQSCIPIKAHNPYPPGDVRHDAHNQRVVG